MANQDDDTPVPFERKRSGPFPGPRPSPGPSRDTGAPRPAPARPTTTPVPNYPPELAHEPKTNPGANATNAWVKRKLRRQAGVAGTIAALLTAAGGFYEHHQDATNEERQARTEQQLVDHIEREAEHHRETTKRLDQLLELEFRRAKEERQ